MKKFFLGLDIGTESVGIACTDENYKLLRARGKDLWAVRLFDEAKDASARRVKRASRRRLQRRQQRIDWLQSLFAQYIQDEEFFIRLNNSAFYVEDKETSGRFSIFNDENYTDVDFYKQYPTIFHLREALLDQSNTLDLRFYYLALHHIIKYRGHFLFEGENQSDFRDLNVLFDNYNALIDDYFPSSDMKLLTSCAKDFRNIALSKKGLKDKNVEAVALYEAKTSQQKEIIKLLLGFKSNMATIFGEDYLEEYKDEKFSFREIDDETFESKREIFGDENFAVIEALKNIFNFILLEKVLDGKRYISSAMVSLYDKHKKDLAILKSVFKGTDMYFKLFRSTTESFNYANYIGFTKNSSTSKKGRKISVKKCKPEEFFKYLKKIIDEYQSQIDDSEKLASLAYIRSELEEGSFLPKILHADKGIFPHQVNGIELDIILQNLANNYPAFNQKESDGYSIVEKIKKIFLYKIPYYVGPLNTAHSNGGKGNSWMVRKEQGQITPWNFDEKVDKSASNMEFIRRMTNKCSYLRGKDVIPKASMYYQAFDVLNQLNKITIDTQPISVELKKDLFDNLFLCNKKVTLKTIKNYLVRVGLISAEEAKDIVIGGVNGEFSANMNSYVLFKSKFGDYVDSNPSIFEDIILWHTLNTDKSLVEEMILSKYSSEKIIVDNIKWIKGLTSFKEFGRLSLEFLLDLPGGTDPVTGEIYSILSRLYHTNFNLNQLLSPEFYSFSEALDEENGIVDSSVTYEDIEELYVSPMVRRGVWQALQMCDEYVKVLGRVPDKIFLEVTRHNEDANEKLKNSKKRQSRKNQLLALYDGLSSDCNDIDQLVAMLNHSDMTDSRLRQERLYLYFLQLGRCAYTGRPISLEDLSSDSYDVDHIVPRSIIKDDSLDNKVLVRREKNEEKKDIYPLPSGFTNQQSFWNLLKDKGLMSSEKYKRLTRIKPLDNDDFREFVNRQLVVTNQTIKVVADLLKIKYSSYGTQIVYSKAGNVDEFKKKFDIVKCRETNDLHHARDAYLNVVVGNVYNTRFTNAYDYYYKNQDDAWREYNLKHLFDRPVSGAWTGKDNISIIRETLSRPMSIQVTRYSYCSHGEFYNQTVYGKGDSGIGAPLKGKGPYLDVNKYGGYKNLNTSYFAIVESIGKKGNIIKTIEAIPVLVDYKSRQNPDAITSYLLDSGLKSPKVICKIKQKALVSVNGYRCWIAGMTGKQVLLHSAQQWYTDATTDLYVKNLVKLVDMAKSGKLSLTECTQDKFAMITNRTGEVSLYIDKEHNISLFHTILDKLSLPLYQSLQPVKSFATKLLAKETKFKSLSTLDQAKVLLQLVRFMKCNPEISDLSMLDEGPNCGKLRINQDITNVDFCIIHQSPCGTSTYIQKV